MGSEQTEVVPRVDDETTTSADDKNALDQSGSTSSDMVCDSNVGNGSNEVSKPDEVLRNLHHVPYVYREDIVRHKKNGGIGIVNEVAGDADSDSSITDDEEDDDDDVDDEDDLDDNDEDTRGDDRGDGEDNIDACRSGEGKRDPKYKDETLQADHIRVLWMGDAEPIQHISDITVIDRGFLHGDFVACALDPTGQVGLVQDVSISVDLLAPDGPIIKDVSSRDLKRVREFVVGDHVVLGPWLGRVNDVLDNVTVLIDDGSVCKVMGADPLRLIPISKNMLDEDEQFPYYPGQRVRASSSSVFRDSRWLSGLWKANRLEGTVTKVTTGSVFIYWMASAGYGPDSATAPAEEQSPKNLKLLSCFAHTNWQLGDWCLLTPSVPQSCSSTLGKGLSNLGLNDPVKSEIESSQLENGCDSEEVTPEDLDDNNEAMDTDPDRNSGNVAESSSCTSSTSVTKEPVHETRPLHRKKIRKVLFRREKKARKKEENFERAFLIVSTRTKVDVAWQDGTIAHGVDSTMLIPIDSPGDHEFIAEQYVMEKASDDADNSFEARRVGVVKSVNAKERTACVRWLKPVSRAEDPREFDKEEIVSVYELEGHQDYDYSYGDVVVRLSPPSVGEPEEKSGPNDTMNTRKSSGCEKGEDESAGEACMDFSDLSWVGNITGLRDGDIEVTWADGMVSKVGPQAIFVVGRDDDDSLAAGSEVSDDAASWETVNDDEMDSHESAQQDDELQNATDVNSEVDECTENNSSRNPALSLPLAALDFVTRLATGIFSRGWKHIDSTDPRGENELQSERMIHISEERDSSDNSSSQKSEVDNYGARGTDGKGEKHVSMEASIVPNGAEALCNLRTENSDSQTCFEDDSGSFKRFDIVKDPVDHYFIGSNGQVNNGRKWFKKVQQDWTILQNNLPDGIYVRVYEDRMDLLRAVIVGAYGTPYQDGLFFFDFHLAPEYPDNPPLAYYHSGGWRINPNLYEEGKVCLSLLNTWTGRGNEVWDPKSSSILQILVSLQGLVLNSKPYFNEAGYDKQIGTAEGEKNSLSYNENTFLLNCKMMVHLMRKPPKDFEELVQEHFRRRGYYILKACDAYMKGCLIGSLTEDASVSNEDNLNLTSVGFKLMLAKIVPKLYLALNEVGADCQEFEHLLQS